MYGLAEWWSVPSRPPISIRLISTTYQLKFRDPNMLSLLLAAGPALKKADWKFSEYMKDPIWLGVAALVVVFGLIFLLVFFSFFRLWLQSKLTNAKIGIL